MFRKSGRRITVELKPGERAFLSQVLDLLDDVGAFEGDPAAQRLDVPAYLDDPVAAEAWRLLMGEELREARLGDRAIFASVVADDGSLRLDDGDALAFLRVLNEGRLALAARLGVEVEEDHDRLPDPDRTALDFLGFVLESLTAELSKSL